MKYLSSKFAKSQVKIKQKSRTLSNISHTSPRTHTHTPFPRVRTGAFRAAGVGGGVLVLGTLAFRAPPPKAPKERRGKKGKKHKPRKQVHKVATAPVTGTWLLVHARMQCARALLHAILALTQLGFQVPQVNDRHAENWFLNRFSELTQVPQPQAVTLATFKNHCSQILTAAKAEAKKKKDTPGQVLARQAIAAFKTAMEKALKALTTPPTPPTVLHPRIKALAHVCLGNMKVLKSADGLNALAATTRVKFSFEKHPTFPVINLKTTPAPKQAPATSQVPPS